MSLLERLDKDYVEAYKAKEQIRLDTLRLLKTAAKNRQVELKHELSDDDVLELIAKQIKQRQDSIEQFKNAGRDAMAEKEAAEMAVLEAYMPPKLSPEELDAAISAAIETTGAAGPKDMGKVMQIMSAEYKGRFDGKALSGLVRERLSSS